MGIDIRNLFSPHRNIFIEQNWGKSRRKALKYEV
jgi:hypothetical protein